MDTIVSEPRLIIVSNRLPIVIQKQGCDGWRIEPASGGLIHALDPVLRDRGGVWIGWPGLVEEDETDVEQLLSSAISDSGYSITSVILTADERDNFYLGFANEVLWPLFHEMPERCHFMPSYWPAYQAVNRKFAQVVARQYRHGDFIWVHDYHLMQVAQYLRSLGICSSIGFFLHIPYPSPEIFLNKPWCAPILHALLEYDLLGFQTTGDQHNFIQCVRALYPQVMIGCVDQMPALKIGNRDVRLVVAPTNIDYHAFAQQAMTNSVSAAIKRMCVSRSEGQLLLGVDRLDYIKGIPQRLEAFGRALRQFSELHGNITLVQVVVPSRTSISIYRDLKREIDQLVDAINEEFAQSDWLPIHYLFGNLPRTELLAHYRTADIALITPFKDGLNAVALEYCACSPDDGVLILSELAGAATQLCGGALLVNPYDSAAIASAIYRAWSMSREERLWRMEAMRCSIRERDVFCWADTFLRMATTRR